MFAIDLSPTKVITMQGDVMDLKILNNFIYVGTDAGTLEVYDIKNNKITETIRLKKIHNFMDDLITPKVYSVDVIGGKKLLLSEGEEGAKELYIDENGVLRKVIGARDKLTMSKARFIDKNHVFLGLLSNEIVLYDLKNRKIIYKKQLSESKFSDFALNEDKSEAVVCCESGINYVVNVQSGKIIKQLQGANKDNVFKVSFKAGKVSTAGQDRIGAVYDVQTGDFIEFKTPFLIYATGLSPNAKMVAFAYNDHNDIEIIDVNSQEKVYNLIGQKSTLNAIVFYDKKTIFSSSDDKYIMKWSLKK